MQIEPRPLLLITLVMRRLPLLGFGELRFALRVRWRRTPAVTIQNHCRERFNANIAAWLRRSGSPLVRRRGYYTEQEVLARAALASAIKRNPHSATATCSGTGTGSLSLANYG